MAWVIVGLGNPGEEYDGTRHNAGRIALDYFAKELKFGEWKEDKKAKSHVASGMLGRISVVLITPDTFMNKSGAAIARFVKSQKAAERLVVLYDDLDLPLGSMKLSFNRGSGGHRGVESIMKSVKTKKFTRVRIGVSPLRASGKLKKPSGEKEVVAFILAKFRSAELAELNPVWKRIAEALQAIVAEGPERAMNQFN